MYFYIYFLHFSFFKNFLYFSNFSFYFSILHIFSKKLDFSSIFNSYFLLLNFYFLHFRIKIRLHVDIYVFYFCSFFDILILILKNGLKKCIVKLCNIYNVSPSFILKDYIKVSDTEFINDSLTGYNTLSDYEKELIIELIRFMNSKKLK